MTIHTQPKKRSKWPLIILCLYAALATYPASLQTVRSVNAMLDDFAQARVGEISDIRTSELDAQLSALSATLPEHLQTPLPTRKP